MNPTAEQIAGSHLALYDAMYRQMNPTNAPAIGAKQAAEFLKRSRLNKQVLIQVWNEADSKRCGFLDRSSFFAALKLIALAQQGHDVTARNLLLDIHPPIMYDPSNTVGSSSDSKSALFWTIQPEEMSKYEEIFANLNPINGKLSGGQVKSVLFNSGLPNKTLGKIWQLSDIDRDGYLDKSEMVLALHLVYRALENDSLPDALSEEMIPPDKRHLFLDTMGQGVRPFGRSESLQQHVPLARSRACSVTSVEPYDGYSVCSSPPAKHLMSRSLSGTPAPLMKTHRFDSRWPVDASKWEAQFNALDTDSDGFVSGDDVRRFFLQTGEPQKTLAHIWNLCDVKCAGRLNLEQFALAMYLVQLKQVDGVELPIVLPVELLPPSFRPSAISTDVDSVTATAAAGSSTPVPSAGNGNSNNASPFSKEMDQIKNEIEAMQKEKREIETQIVQSEADMKVKQAEIRNLEVEYNTLEATINQLKRQKVAAQQRLEELEVQKVTLESTAAELKAKVEREEREWTLLRETVELVCSSAKQQQDEIESKQLELHHLRAEEHRIEDNLNQQKNNLVSLSHHEHECEANIERLTSIVDKLKNQRKLLAELLAASNEAVAPHLVQMLERDELFLPPLHSIAPVKSGTTAAGDGTTAEQESVPSVVADPFIHADPFAQIHFPSSADPFPQYSVQETFQDSYANDDPFRPVDQSEEAAAQRRPQFQPADPFHDQAAITGPKKDFDPWAANVVQTEASQKKKPPPRPALPTGHDGRISNPFNPAQSAAGAEQSFANFADFSKFA